jgi:DNA polymerase sigma
MKFLRTKKNTKIYKNIFLNLKKEILSNELVKNKILKILPYGSVTQCTNNEKSDVEMTIITKNYETATKEYISKIFEDILDKIENEQNIEFEIFMEGIRETKRTILLLLRHKETNTEIEINCNNFFSVMNSNLIRNYLVYDARALILLNTIKDWSKIKGINSNNKGYLSSYCYTLMTIFFLQRIKQPLLPIISSYNDLINLKVSEKEFYIEKQLLQSSEMMQKWHTTNKEDTVTTLLLKWMIFYLYLFNGEEYCIDISNKRLTFRFNEAKYLTSFISGNNKLSAYCFIDMFDYTYNPGSYMEIDSNEHSIFKDVLKESIEQLLEGKKEFFYPRNN